ncbi:MAG: carboxypeptidase-like regulatory domain-containing protein [Paludibacteraceae bacterium]|nr:carboxypeptidase-like regulatory domain-containing protein [Paludibacteraceae bacterium]
MRKLFTIILSIYCLVSVSATVYQGRVIDEKGNAVGYATVYPEQQPEIGTATNSDGYFRFEAELSSNSMVIVSFIGYEKQSLPLHYFAFNSESVASIVLKEQPIALEGTVVAAKASKQKNKRKQMATLLHSVYVKMCDEFPRENVRYNVVSDVRMQSNGSTWGMEQMISNVVVLPEYKKNGNDSIQWQGRYCKRFFNAEKRALADTILAGNSIERMEKKATRGHSQSALRNAANAVDSGVVVHRTLFAMGNMRYDFEQAMNDIRHWQVTNESEGETVLTHTQTVSKYLGCLKITMKRHYIVDSHTYAVRRFSEHADVQITIPFGVKLDADQLQMLNLFNMGDTQIEKFRLQKLTGHIDYNTIYQRRNGKLYILEKNLTTNAKILGTKKAEIPVVLKATQRVTGLETTGVKPLSKSQITRRLSRQIVEVY